MAKAKQKFPGIQFIVHKVRNLADYDKSVQLNFDLPANRIIVSSTEAGTDRFREERTKQMVVSFDHRDRLRIDSGAKETLPDGLINPAFACIRALAEYATMQGHPVFEASFVTYREAPGQPEFYDLIFGKRM
jgi:hypothetical protein